MAANAYFLMGLLVLTFATEGLLEQGFADGIIGEVGRKLGGIIVVDGSGEGTPVSPHTSCWFTRG